MSLKLRKDCKWGLLVPSSMGVRITPVNHQPVHCSDTFHMQATSAETNVATIPAYLGLPVKVLTAFVKDSPIAQFIKSDLRKRRLDYEGPEIAQGGPWGYRHQFNIADSGFGVRGPKVQNDRAGEVGCILNSNFYDLERIFGEEGVQIVHLSGLIAALSPETGKFCVELARIAKKHGTLISFDINFRASFWEGREKELREIFNEIASLSDIIIGFKEVFNLCLGHEMPETHGVSVSETMADFKKVLLQMRKYCPNVSVLITTFRNELSVNEHLWGGVMLAGEEWYEVEPRPIRVLDRIGGGDGFMGGLLYGILKGWEPEKWLQFGWATGALATTFITDYALPSDEASVWSIWRGNTKVVR